MLLRVIVFLCLFCLGNAIACGQSENPQRPNIVLIMADDIGAECFADYGGLDYKTPCIDALGRTGLRFKYAFSQPVCTPTRVQIMTGRYNHRNYEGFGYLNPNEVTFANLLKDAGYRTCIAGKWQLSGNASTIKHFGFDQHCVWNMMKYVEQDTDGIEPQPEGYRRRYSDPVLYRNGEWIRPGKDAYGPDVCTEFILDFIDAESDAPFLVYYPMILTHDPFVPTPFSPQGQKNKKKNFQDMVEHMDRLVGKIVDKLEEKGVRDNTLVIFTGDNGTHVSITSETTSGEVQGGKSHPINRGTHVPFYLSWPDRVQPGVQDALVDFTDVLPTLVEVAQANLPQDRKLDGRSLVPIVTGESDHHRSSVFFYYWGRGRNAKNITAWVRDRRFMLYEDGRFFDLQEDPRQEQPIEGELSAEQEDGKSKLQKELQRYLDSKP